MKRVVFDSRVTERSTMATTVEATDGVTGQMYSTPQTVGQLSNTSANQWHQFFGPPAGEIKTNPYDKYQYETYTLPDAYRGKNIYVRDTIEGFLDTTNNWYTSVALPIQVTDQLHVRWNEFRFDQALASIVPEEGISRLITSSKEAREDHTIRHGLAFVLEHGFMTTDEGRRQYALNIQQIAQSVQETNNYDVVSALLNCREYEREWEKRHSMIRTPWNDLGKREVMEFGIVQKDFRGFEILHEKYKHRLQRYGVSPTMWVFPPGLALYAAFDPNLAQHSKETPGIELQTGPEVLGSFRGLNVFETREFDVRQGELPINLLQRRVQIGEHYFMRNHHSDNAAYKTNLSMDIVVYNEDRDDWEKISFRDAINNCQRFKANGGLNTDDFKLDPPAEDLFTYKSTDFTDDTRHQWCDVIGQMEDNHLPAEALRAFCESAERHMEKSLDVAAKDTLRRDASTAMNLNDDDEYGARSGTGCMDDVLKKVFLNQVVPGLEKLLIGRPELYYESGGDGGIENAEFTALLAKYSGPIAAELMAQFGTSDQRQAAAGAGATGEELDGKHAKKQLALKIYLEKHTLKKADVKDLVQSARFQEVLGGAAEYTRQLLPLRLKDDETGAVGDAKDQRYLNRAVIIGGDGVLTASQKYDRTVLDAKVETPTGVTGASLRVYVNRRWLRVTDPENRQDLLELCTPSFEFARSAPAAFPPPPEPFNPETFAGIGSKRSMTQPTRAWKRRGISDFTSEFAPIGANVGKDSSNYVDPKAANYDDLDFSTIEQGLKVNDKHIKYAAKAATLSTSLQKVIAHCMYYARPTGTLVQHWMNIDVVLPFSVIVARPFMTYDMATCIMMKGGSDTGATYQGHSDFQLGDDVQSKIHYGNYTYYSKAIVTNHKNVIHARNVLANGYAGGDGTTWRNPRTQKGDMCAFLVPYNEHKKSNPLRVFSVDDEHPEQSMTGALFYSRVYGQAALPANVLFSTMTEQEDGNDITYMGHHFWWKPHREQNESGTTKGSYTGVTVNTGHWGPKVYPGCGRVRAGDEIYLKDPEYGQEVF